MTAAAFRFSGSRTLIIRQLTIVCDDIMKSGIFEGTYIKGDGVGGGFQMYDVKITKCRIPADQSFWRFFIFLLIFLV